jgi:hypothetical protein
MTMVAGKDSLYEDGEFHIGTAPDEIYRKAKKLQSAL